MNIYLKLLHRAMENVFSKYDGSFLFRLFSGRQAEFTLLRVAGTKTALSREYLRHIGYLKS